MTRSSHGVVGPFEAPWFMPFSDPPVAAADVPAASPGWLPRGDALSQGDWRWRHRFVCGVLAAHLPALALLDYVTGATLAAWLFLLPLVALLAIAVLAPRRRVQSLAATLGLIGCSALLQAAVEPRVEAHFHVFVVLAVLALYQDWIAFALALGFVGAHNVALATMDSAGPDAWVIGALQSGALVVEAAVLGVFWRAHELGRAAEAQLRAELESGHTSVRARLAEADRIRADLIGTVSHEFRTPLTGIRGAALTLLKRGDRLDKQGRDRLLHAVLDQQERLSRLLENMLTAAQATDADPDAQAEVDAVAAEVAMLAAAGRPGLAVSVVVAPGTTARIDRPALHQVLANLVDNALQHGVPGAVPVLAGGTDAHGVWLTISNEGRTIDLTANGRLFEPFTQVDSGATREREGIGVGLYVVRRLVEVYGGSVDVRSDSGWVTVDVRLKAPASPSVTPLVDRRTRSLAT